MKEKTSRNSQKLFISLSVIIALTVSFSIADWVLQYQSKAFNEKISNSEKMDPGMILYDAQLGWKLKPYWTGKHHHFDYDVSYNINKDGFRGNSVINTNDGYALFGDSFSFGLGVDDNETFSVLFNADIDNKIIYKNYSVPGYSTDQQLLLINKLKHEISNKLLLVVYLGNDIFDNMRDYPLQAAHGKPYFILENNTLSLKNTPVSRASKPAAARADSISKIVLNAYAGNNNITDWLGEFEIFRRLGLFEKNIVLTDEYMKTQFSQSLELFDSLIQKIKKIAVEKNGQLEVMLLPGRSYVEQPESLSAQYQEYFRKTIKQTLSASSIDVMDLATHLRELQKNNIKNLYFPNEGHLTPLGHQYVAAYLKQQNTRPGPMATPE